MPNGGFYPEKNNAATDLEVEILTSYESLQNLIHCQPTLGIASTSILPMTLQMFILTNLLLSDGAPIYSPNWTLWNNPNLHEFFQRTYGAFWLRCGVKLICTYSWRICSTPLMGFVETFTFPLVHFRHLLLRHTAGTQFGLQNISIQPSPLEHLFSNLANSKLIFILLLFITF